MSEKRHALPPLSGILNINKPSGLTSHDVVHRVRRILKQRKAGHAGTLDPTATGVLLVCVGQATRLVEYLVKSTKEYRAVIRFGVATNTYDAAGEVTATADANGLTRSQVRQALEAFIGEIRQKPPPFSAIKKDGVPLYKLARRGQRVDPPSRPVYIDSIELLAWERSLATILVRCQAGTYIRSLAHDAGQRLGVGAHLSDLTRTASGEWRLEDAITLDTLAQAAAAGTAARLLHPLDAAIAAMPAVTLSAATARRVIFGQKIELDVPGEPPTVRAYTPAGDFLAILIPSSPGVWQPHKVFTAALSP
ncbi:MAG: tRNA pseudouridine(55) synthase TruB [Anaerolineae bacterium]